MFMKKPLVIIAGPTAVGKTAISVKLAGKIGGEIISADSMQVYKGMDIGSAKVTHKEMRGIPHYLIDVLDPHEDFNIFFFREQAEKAIETIYSNGHIPIIAGGTGFYIHALLYQTDFTESNGENTALREELFKLADEKGPEAVHDMLKELDMQSADAIHPNNVKRVIRAIEFFKETGKSIQTHNEEMRAKASPYDHAFYCLTRNRKDLYAAIDQRVDGMMAAGLLNEVIKLKEQGLSRDNHSMLGLGYKEILDHLNGEISLEEAVYRIKRDSRHYAKKQLTWFKREEDVIFIDRDEYKEDEAVIGHMIKDLTDRGIITENHNG